MGEPVFARQKNPTSPRCCWRNTTRRCGRKNNAHKKDDPGRYPGLEGNLERGVRPKTPGRISTNFLKRSTRTRRAFARRMKQARVRHALCSPQTIVKGEKAAQGRLSLRRRNKERAPWPRLLQSRDDLRGKGASQAVRGRASFKPCDAGPCGFLRQTRLFPPDGRQQIDVELCRGEGTGDRDRRTGLRGSSRDRRSGIFRMCATTRHSWSTRYRAENFTA